MGETAHTKTQHRDSYHHGNLPTVLVDEAALLLAEKGADGFSLRALARRVGVSVATPSHHFAGAKGVLTAVATRGFEALTAHQQEAMETRHDPVEQVIAICLTYVRMGVKHPGYAAVMFRWDMVDLEDAAYVKASSAALAVLRNAVAQAAPEGSEVEHATKTLWATMHGFVTLSLTDGDAAQDRIAFAVRTLLKGMDAR